MYQAVDVKSLLITQPLTNESIMKVHELPDDIFTDKTLPSSDIIFYHYSSEKDSFKEKSILKRNAFSLVINGRKTMHFAEKTVHINDHEVHLLSAGNCIASVNIERNKNKPFESLLVFFNDKVLFDFESKHAGLISNQKNKVQKKDAYIEFEKDEFLNHFIQSVLMVMKNGRQPSESMKQLKMQELFLYLAENYPNKMLSFKHTQPIPDIELKIRKVAEANIYNNLTIEELAFLSDVSTSTFKRYFKKIYNSTPIEWNNKQRMKLASQLLMKEKPGEIWHKLGYETHTGFTKSFKRYFGILPRDFTHKMTLQE
jgi:AraC family transcriptional regulator, exoenzyme S synthesis regulatory protein ExsA